MRTSGEVHESGATRADSDGPQRRDKQFLGNGDACEAHDANGNRTSQTINATTTYATFDSRDRMSTQGDLDLTYNANGELTEKRDRVTGETLSLNYTTLGDLSSATTPAGDQINYLLDGMGRRVGKKIDGNLTQGLLYSSEAFGPVAELNADNSLKSRFIYTGAHVPAYMVKNGTTYRMLTDQLGSVVMVVDASSGAVAQELSYGPFGEVLEDSNPGFQPFGFAGGLYDTDTGLTHFGAREYDAGLGRWTAGDPIGFGGGDSNLYGYVLGDPVNLADPLGLAALPVLGGTPIADPVDAGKELLGPYAEDAQEYYAAVTNDPYASRAAKAAAWVGGLLASLATCENFEKTVLVIGGFGGAGAFAGARGYTNLFGRNGQGLLNNNDFLRVGWGWTGSRTGGNEVFRVVFGKPGGRFHKHLDVHHRSAN